MCCLTSCIILLYIDVSSGTHPDSNTVTSSRPDYGDGFGHAMLVLAHFSYSSLFHIIIARHCKLKTAWSPLSTAIKGHCRMTFDPRKCTYNKLYHKISIHIRSFARCAYPANYACVYISSIYNIIVLVHP